MKRIEALARAARALVQGLIAAFAVAAWNAGNSVFAAQGFNPRVIIEAGVTAGVLAAVTYVFNWFAPRLGVSGSPSAEALIRLARTAVAGAITVGLMSGWEALWSAWQSGSFSPWVALTAAGTAAVAAVAAYVHNLVSPRDPVRPASLRARV